jgi:hypothetical protein
MLDQGLVVLAGAIAFLARHGFLPASVEISALATAWMVPLLSRDVAGIAQA